MRCVLFIWMITAWVFAGLFTLSNDPPDHLFGQMPDHLRSTGHIEDTALKLTPLPGPSSPEIDSLDRFLMPSANRLRSMQARYYDPKIGRFLSNDPVGFAGSELNPKMFGRYVYAWNDPVNLTDPDGKCPWCFGAAIGALAKAIEIKAQGGKILSKEGVAQIAGAAAIGAVGGSAGAIVSSSIKGVAALAGVTKAASGASKVTKAVNASGSIAADTAGGAVGDVVATAISQGFTEPSARTGNEGLNSAAKSGAALSAASSTTGQVIEATTGKQFSPSAASAAGSRASKVLDAGIAAYSAYKKGLSENEIEDQ